MSRFAANPKWLIYLPPTMSTVATSAEPGFLEHPQQALAYYQQAGISQVICEEKHMGSRTVVIVCRDETAVHRRFGILNEGIGICYTRTGRRFFDDPLLETELLSRLNAALTRKRLLGAVSHRLGLLGLRTHALVRKSSKIIAGTICCGRCCRPSRLDWGDRLFETSWRSRY